jgi:hypothetical protein
MKLIASVAAVLAGMAAAGSAAAPQEQLGKPHTIASTKLRIAQFAQDGNWVAWSELQRACGVQMRLFSLRTHERVSIPHAGSDVGCGAYGGLALARNRVLWMVFTGAGNTELDVAVVTATSGTPKPRIVRKMSMVRDGYAPEPLPPTHRRPRQPARLLPA